MVKEFIIDISKRKSDHIRICLEDEIEYKNKSTLLEDVHFFHDSLPELSMDEIDLSSTFCGHSLNAPILISGMTGGSTDAQPINKALAKLAQDFGFAFGVGSQRAILKDPKLASTYQVRDVAPDVFLLGNIGAVQVAEISTAAIEDLVGVIGANAMCVHLNPGQELIQPNGDRDFRGCVDAISRLVDELSVPVIVKETGCGFSPDALDKILKTGAKHVEVSGAGGTTWIGVETKRAEGLQRQIGELLWDWGVPTAPSIHYAAERKLSIIGSGGIRNAKDMAAALFLGADLCGMARPWLVAHSDGREAELATEILEGLRTIFCLTGSKNIAELRSKRCRIGSGLSSWI